ncbi:MAG: alpha/beta fold hydrolase [Rhizobiaceae bacterium]
MQTKLPDEKRTSLPSFEGQKAWALALTKMAEVNKNAYRNNSTLHHYQSTEVEIAKTEHDVVLQIDKMRLLRYRALTSRNLSIPPVIICYGLVGRYSIIDIHHDRSLVRNLLQAGIDVFVIDWGTPTRIDQYLDFDDYIGDYLRACIEHVYRLNNDQPATLFGICEGGTMAAMQAALQPNLLAGLALAITPIDFHGAPKEFRLGEGFINIWAQNLEAEDIELLLETYGMLPGAFIGNIFSSLTHVSGLSKLSLDLKNLNNDPEATMDFLRMEKWIADRPDHAGAAARQLINQLYRENQLIKGLFEVQGEKIDLSRITCPVINIYAKQDHIIPNSCTTALGKFINPERYHELGIDGGHVGIFVSKKAQGIVADGLIGWMNSI